VYGLRIAQLSLLLASFALTVGAASAAAGTYCVQDPACVVAGGVDEPTIAAALAGAGGTDGLDRVEIGPGTFVEGGLVAGTGNPVEIVGDGVGSTVIASPGEPTGVALWLGDPASSVSDLSIVLPARGGQQGLATNGMARRVAVTAPQGMTGTGVSLTGSGSFLDGSVALPPEETWGITANTSASNTASVERSTIAAYTGIYNINTVRHVRVTAVDGIVARTDFTPTVNVTVDDALVVMGPGPWGTALEARIGAASANAAATLRARHVTAIGNGDSLSTGVASIAERGVFGPGVTAATVTVSGVILREFGTDLLRTAAGGSDPSHTSVADIAIDHSNVDLTKQWNENQIGGGSASGSIDAGPHNLNVDPLFSGPAAGDFSLRPDSPLIDRGSPDPLAADEPTTDLPGNPRVVDGDGDAVAIADIGAFEYVPPPLPAVGSLAIPPAPIAPVLTALSLRPARFAVTHPATADAATRRHVRRAAKGTTIHFSLSRSATVAFAVERRVSGHRVRGACVRPTRALRRAKRCRRWAVVFKFSRDGRAGANAIPFSGRRPSGPLAPRRYRLRAVASADALSSSPATARFAIVRE